jgi:hypothetical protein
VRNRSLSVDDWNHLLKQIYRCTKPGGYFGLAECEFTINSGDRTASPDFQEYMKLLTEACVKLKRPTVTAAMAKDLLDRGGFEDVKVVTLKQPFGPWAKDERMKKIGAMVLLTADAGAEGYGLAMFTRVLGMTPEDSLALCQRTSAEIRNKNYHVWEPL